MARAKDIKVVKSVKVVLLSLLVAVFVLQVGFAGVRLFFDIKYHRPVRFSTYVLGSELVTGSMPAKLRVENASWHERKMIAEAYGSIGLDLDHVLDRPVRVVVTDTRKQVAYGGESVDAAGYYNAARDVIVLVRHRAVLPGFDDLEYYRSTLGHEMMHLVDNRYLTDQDRDEYLSLRGIEGLAWGKGGDRAMNGWSLTPEEDWAEVASTLFTGARIGGPRTRLGERIDIDALREFIQETVER